MKFYGYIPRTNNNALAKRILTLALSLKMTNNWLRGIERNLQEFTSQWQLEREEIH